jgi:hypothetical protein
MHVRDIPAPWLGVLAAIQAIAPEAHIAGGALRDLDNGRPVKDIDIFIPAEKDVAVSLLLLELGFERTVGLDLSSMAGADPAVSLSIEWHKEGHLPVNTVFLTRGTAVADNLARLDLGLCQIAFDGQCLLKTNAYRDDQADQFFTIVRADNQTQLDRTYGRYERLRKKYPGWALIDPTRWDDAGNRIA